MGFKPRAKARKYGVQSGDDLEKIAHDAGVTWQQVALFNWGTCDPKGVARAMFEIVGCEKWPPNPPEYAFTGNETRYGSGQVLIPEYWNKQYNLDTTHKIKLKKVLPATAVGITKLDKWFIPATESCDFSYALEGAAARANKLKLEIFASNYCKATPTDDGEFVKYTYSALDIPVYDETFDVQEAKAYTKTDWKGKSKASDGVLKPRDNTERFIDAAHSPYTIHLRYYKDSADEKARIDLKPFWPQFEKDKVKQDTLEIKWEIKETEKLDHGQLLIFDKDGIAFRVALPKAKLAKGNQSYTWDGKHSDGRTAIKAENMPYRAQIQAHTGVDEDNGLALAAMHTEVRLFVHADVDKDPDNPVEASRCLELALAPFLPYRDKAKDRPAEGSKEWYKLRLAEAGFHPGPVGKDGIGPGMQIALEEFQRSVPQVRTDNTKPFERLAADGSQNDETKKALADAAANLRAMFGNPADRDDYTPDQVKPLIQNPGQDLIVWVDDRHCYTAGAWKPHPAKFTTARYDMADYRGGMSVGDGRVAKDEASCPRPYIPLEARLALLSKNQPLEPKTAMPEVTDAMRAAIGPLCLDWRFSELAPDVSVIPDGRERTVAKIEVDGAVTAGTFKLTYDGETTGNLAKNASAAQIETALKALPKIAAKNDRKKRISVSGAAGGPWSVTFESGFSGPAVTTITADGSSLTGGGMTVSAQQIKITRAKKFMEQILSQESPNGYAKKNGAKLYTNCPEKINAKNCGGIRPDDLSKYYKAPFSLGKTGSLLPWMAIDDSAEKRVVTVCHADLGQDEKKVYPDFVGKSGIYLHPSRMAGDGYRFQARVSFKPIPGGGDWPNREVLEKRYPKLPQAHTAKMRIWRRASFRGYVGWVKTVAPGWEGGMDDAADHYKGAHVHFVHEGPDPKTHQEFPVKGADKLISDAEYKDLMADRLTGSPYNSIKGDAKLTEGYVWPFLHKPHFGVKWRVGDIDAFETWLYGTIEETSWDLYSKELIHLLIAKIESKHGRMRGHTMVEFNSSPPVVFVEYTCDNCSDKVTEIVNDEAAGAVKGWSWGHKVTLRLQDQTCRLVGCGGQYKGGSARQISDGLPLCAIGRPLGGCWLYTPRNAATWAHEMGHHRHLQHAQAYANRTIIAPGGQTKQHDSATHPEFTAANLSAFQKAWDRFCVMSYDKGESRAFCGKCLLRNRGWAVEDIANPDGALHD